MRASPPVPAFGLDARLVAISVTILLALISAVPLQLTGLASVAPDLVLISLFHWTLYYPQSLPYAVLFAIGLVVDVLTGAPWGLTPLLLLVARWAVLNNRRYFVGRSFPFVWAGFSLIAAAVTLAAWSVTSFFHQHLLDPRAFLFQTLLTVALFPPLARLFTLLQRAIASV